MAGSGDQGLFGVRDLAKESEDGGVEALDLVVVSLDKDDV